MNMRTRRTLEDDVAITELLSSVTFVAVSALLSELIASKQLPEEARARIRGFIDRGIESSSAPERAKAYVRPLLRAHFPSA